MRKWANAAAIGVLAILGLSDQATAAELIVLAGQGNAPGARELGAAFARDERPQGDGAGGGRRRAGEADQRGAADLITLGPAAMDDLVKKNGVVANSATPYMLAGLGISVRAGAPKPEHQHGRGLSRRHCWRRSRSAIRAVAAASTSRKGSRSSASPRHLKSKTVRTGGGAGPVTFFLAKGDFELGIQQTNIMVGAPGTDYVGPVPEA